MIIRQASTHDVATIKGIHDLQSVSRNQAGWKERKTGFFEYPKTENDFERCLNPYFIVAEISGDVKGFALSYDDEFLKSWNFDRPEMRVFEKREKFLYIDQLGVANYMSLGSGKIANYLCDTVVEMARMHGLQRVFGCICEKPFADERSISFAERKGMRRVSELTIGDVLLGVYELAI
ncbi:MAG: hypothetical protein NT120_04980 [Candidatus Aenigmarchaeota archaeon]|nr:hypothetical protein [Candidatus Aenigmarchaeota archaeon]